MGRSRTVVKSNGRSSVSFGGKPKPKPNGSILNFFKRAPCTSPAGGNMDLEESLFVEDNDSPKKQEVRQIPTPPMDSCSLESSPEAGGVFEEDEHVLRYNEEPGAIKRQRVESPSPRSPSLSTQQARNVVRTGPFLEDSDDDDEAIAKFGKRCLEDDSYPQITPCVEPQKEALLEVTSTKPEVVHSQSIPALKHERTSIEEEIGFEDMEDFIDDEFPEEGEEYLERKWMEEHGKFEPIPDEIEPEDIADSRIKFNEDDKTIVQPETLNPACPVCSRSLDGLTDQVG
jgi:DNA cross-link repair 1A protein